MTYPQFDLILSDGKPNPVSLDYRDAQDPDARRANSLRKQLLSVSLINIDKVARTFVSPQSLGRTALFKHRVGVYTLLHVADAGETGNACEKSLRFVSYDLTPVRRGEALPQVTSTSPLPTRAYFNPLPKNSPQWTSTLVEDSLWGRAPDRNTPHDPLPPEVRTAPSQAQPFFSPCIKESLNTALERAAHEVMTEKHSTSKFSINKIYEFRSEKNPHESQVVVNLTVTVDGWIELPYSFKFDVAPKDNDCGVRQVRTR